MGVVAVHRVSSLDTGDQPSHDACDTVIRALGSTPGPGWVYLFTEVREEVNGYVGPENDPKWCKAHGVAWRREYPIDDHPVGIHKL